MDFSKGFGVFWCFFPRDLFHFSKRFVFFCLRFFFLEGSVFFHRFFFLNKFSHKKGGVVCFSKGIVFAKRFSFSKIFSQIFFNVFFSKVFLFSKHFCYFNRVFFQRGCFSQILVLSGMFFLKGFFQRYFLLLKFFFFHIFLFSLLRKFFFQKFVFQFFSTGFLFIRFFFKDFC